MMRRDGYSPELGNVAHSSGPFSKAAPNGFSKVHSSLNGSSSPHTNGHNANGVVSCYCTSRKTVPSLAMTEKKSRGLSFRG